LPSFQRFVARLKRLLLFAITLTAIAYAGDFAWLRIRMLKPKPGNPFDTIHLERFYAISLKNGKYDFVAAPPEDRPCVKTLFPHGGLSPCWYVRRLNGKPIVE